jgi:hypothetical protein
MKRYIVALSASLFALTSFAGVKPSGPASTEPVEYYEVPAEAPVTKKTKKAKKAAAAEAPKAEDKK